MKEIIETLKTETESSLRALHALIQFYTFLSDYQSLEKVNENPYFWKVFESALTTKLFVSIRRLFDDGKDTFKFSSVVGSCKKRIHEFKKPALEIRKMNGDSCRPVWLDQYLLEAYEANQEDFAKLSKLVWKNSRNMSGKYKEAATLVFVHAIETDKFAISNRLSELEFEEIEISLNAIWHFCVQVQQMYDNGIEPSFDIKPYPYVAEVRNSVIRQLGISS